MKKFQYKAIKKGNAAVDRSYHPWHNAFEEWLDALGVEGWELISIDYEYFIFKREYE